MAKHPLDKIFREKLKTHEIQPRKEAWEKLEFLLDENLEGKQKRKGGFLWVSIAAAFALFVLSFGVWQALQEPKKDISKNDTLKFDLKQNNKNLSQENGKINDVKTDSNTIETPKQKVELPLPNNLNTKNQISIKENKQKIIQPMQENKEKLEQKPVLEKEKTDMQVADNQNNSNAENEDEKTFKVVVKVKLAPVAKTSSTETKETLVAENGKRRGKKLDKVLQSVQDLKNQETDLYTVLGLAKDKGN